VVGFRPRCLVRRVLPGGWAGWWAGGKAFRVGGWGVAVCLRASGQRAPSRNVVNGLANFSASKPNRPGSRGAASDRGMPVHGQPGHALYKGGRRGRQLDSFWGGHFTSVR
jgi:hypothetical protein